ncbi:E3 ubiquitin-protein ligase At4g11680-like [Lotus japonicus]|uniref:E3 ubiquitin-protein ligase At4g11680-like n=1 Tax=Lotus japonicus TaxID=34305 RepID=UPI00258A745C|nr:E3 ubiquitin-protein ligase At4g11680-like [Lotus japonicus]
MRSVVILLGASYAHSMNKIQNPKSVKARTCLVLIWKKMVYGASCALSYGTIWRQPTLHLQFHRCSSLSFNLNFNNNKLSTFPFNRSGPSLTQLSFHDSRLSALSNDGSGGTGGGSGGWNPGDGDDDGVEKWSFFLSCVRKELEPMKSLASAACWVFGFYWFFVGGQAAIEDCPDLLWVMMDFVAYDLFCTYFYIGMAGVVFFAMILIIALAYANATRIREGASEEDIRSLPKYRFSQSNSLMTIDDNMESNGSHTSEISLHPDDSECCICLCTYDDGTELYRLPCTHHFHCECISRWLRTKATCPLCTLDIHGSSRLAG